jgi:hypothetical protein
MKTNRSSERRASNYKSEAVKISSRVVFLVNFFWSMFRGESGGRQSPGIALRWNELWHLLGVGERIGEHGPVVTHVSYEGSTPVAELISQARTHQPRNKIILLTGEP